MVSNWGGGNGLSPSLGEVVAKLTILAVYPVMFLSLTYLLMTFIRRISTRQITGAAGPVLSLIVVVTVIFTITITSIGMTDWDFVRFDRDFQSAFAWNWYIVVGILFESSYGNSIDVFDTVILLTPVILVSLITTLAAIVLASRELRFTNIATPKRVQQDRERRQVEELAPGESIDEIFGIEKE